MTTKTIVTTVAATIAGLALVMSTVVYAQNYDHMGNGQTTGMMGETTEQTTTNKDTHNTMNGNSVQKSNHGGMHAQSTSNHHPVAGHHTGNSQATSNYPCQANSGSKTGIKS